MAQIYAYFQAKIEASRVHRGVLPPWNWEVPSGRLDPAIKVREERRFQKVFCEINNNKGRKT